jgi:hypothetical protein
MPDEQPRLQSGMTLPAAPASPSQTIDPETGFGIRHDAAGRMILQLTPGLAPDDDDDDDDGKTSTFSNNLAKKLGSGQLAHLAEELIRGFEADERSRANWVENLSKGLDLLGLKIEEPKQDGSSAAPLEGMSTVRSPILLESVIRFQSNASGELLPADGPVKVKDDKPASASNPNPTPADPAMMGHNGGPPMDPTDPSAPPPGQQGLAGAAPPALNPLDDRDRLSEALEKDMNHYFTVTASEYYPDTKRMLFGVGFYGTAFKKVYRDPLRKRPVSESVSVNDLIVNFGATDLRNAVRITHRIKMAQTVAKRMQRTGFWLDVPLGSPTVTTRGLDNKLADLQGINDPSPQPNDIEHTFLEMYTDIMLEDYGWTDSKADSKVPVPYRVTIELTSRQVVEIRRNWDEDDDLYLAKQHFVKFGFLPAFGFYDLGLLHLLGNTTMSLTAITRELIDAGQFANFPGFLVASLLGRQDSNTFRVPPGGGMAVDTGGIPIGDCIMPLPYKGADPTLQSLAQAIEQQAQRMGGTAEIQVGEGKQDAPVGTTIALIEQATKVVAAVHKGLHASQAEEFRLMRDLMAEDPECLWRGRKHSAMPQDAKLVIKALGDLNLVPAADPNIPSHMHRVMQAMALVQLAGAFPGVLDPKMVAEKILAIIGIDNYDDLLAPPQQAPQGPSPEELKMQELQTQKQIADGKNQTTLAAAAIHQKEVETETADRAADRQSRESIAALKAHTDIIKPHLGPAGGPGSGVGPQLEQPIGG